MSMNVLSVKQPHAFLLSIGLKPIENRTWKLPEKYKNERVLIHASGKPIKYDNWYDSPLSNEQIISFPFNFDFPKLETSAIIGSVRFVDCVINHESIWAEKTDIPLLGDVLDDLKHFGRAIPPRIIFNWLAADPILFDKPILNVKGRLGFWDYPADILICPYCGKVCLHDNSDVGVPNWGNPVHECEHCKEMILESDYQILK